MGRNISASRDAVDQPLSFVAEDIVAAGDLVKMASSGWVRKVSEIASVAAQNSALGVTALVASYSPAPAAASYGLSSNTSVPVHYRNVLKLPNGGFALAYAGNGSSYGTGVQLSIYSAAGVRQITTVLSAVASIGSARVTFAGASNAMVVWSEGTALRMAVVNVTTGAIVLASVAVGTVAATGNDYNLATLANGDAVIAYPNAGDMVFARYSSAGVLQGAQTTVEAGQTPLWVTVLPLAAGGFVVRWAKTSATAGQRMARFNAAGVIQGAVVAISSGAGLFDGGGTPVLAGCMEGKIIEVSNGNIVTTSAASTTATELKVYDPALALLSTIALGTVSTNLFDIVQLAPKFGGGFWVAGQAINDAVQERDNAGILQRASPANMATSACRIIDRPGNGPLLTGFAHSASTSSFVQMFCMLPDLSARESGTGYAAYQSVSTGCSSEWQEILTTGYLLTVASPSAAAITATIAITGAASVVGVAQGAAVAGQAVKVATAGKLPMNQTLTSSPFDRRASTPMGTKGVTVGNTAVLSGFVD